MSTAPYYSGMAQPYAAVPVTGPITPVDRNGILPGPTGVLAAMYIASVPMFSYASASYSFIPQVMGILLLVGWLGLGLLLGHRLVWPRGITLYVFWFAWATTGLLVAPDKGYFFTLMQTTLKVVAVTWVITQCVRSRSDLMIVFLALGVAAYVAFYLGADDIVRAAHYTGRHAMAGPRVDTSLLANPNKLGKFGWYVVVGATLMIFAVRSFSWKLLGVLILPPALYLTAASGSRTAMLGMMLFAGLVWWYHFRSAGPLSFSGKIFMACLGLGVCGAALLFVTKIPTFVRFTTVFSSADEMMDEPRLRYFLLALEGTIRSPIIGWGLGGFVSTGLAAHYSHSTIGETLVATGIVGAVIYYLAYWYILMDMRKLRAMDLPRADRYMMNMLLPFMIGLVAQSLISVDYDDRLLWPLLGCICGYMSYLKLTYAPQQVAAPLVLSGTAGVPWVGGMSAAEYGYERRRPY